MQKAAVIGAGSWGTAFAGVLAANAENVSIWCHSEECASSINATHRSNRYLLDYNLPLNVSASTSFEEVINGASLVVFAVPSLHLRDVATRAKLFIDQDVPVLVLTKGVEPASGMLMTEVVASEIGNDKRICALTGPNHAEEVSKQAYSAAVCAGSNLNLAEQIRDEICTKTFRVYASADERGVEVCGATKNVIAIACGIVAGMGLGDNTLAVIMTRGIAEIGRMVSTLGGNPLTCMGLAGMGDLVATCTSQHSRNRRFGEAFVKGISLEQFEASTHMVVEGAHACVSIRELAHKNHVEVPIVGAIYNLLYEDASLELVIKALSERTPTQEFYGMSLH